MNRVKWVQHDGIICVDSIDTHVANFMECASGDTFRRALAACITHIAATFPDTINGNACLEDFLCACDIPVESIFSE